jgi:hypothetical protein
MSDSTALLPIDSPACCLTCHYPLRELTVNRCPECGREFDPDDPATMYLGRGVPGRIFRFLMRPPGWQMHAAVAIAAALLLISGSVPGTFGDLLATGAFCGTVLAVLWFIRFVIAIDYNTLSFKEAAIRRRWLTTPAVVVVTILLLWVQAPLHVTFWLSESAMNRMARDVMKSPIGKGKPNGWIGLYPATGIQRIEGGMQFSIRRLGYLPSTPGSDGKESWGFAYYPDGPPPDSYYLEYVHFGGPWYLCISRWMPRGAA